MSEIHFSADLDHSKLDEAIRKSNKTIKDWAKDVEKAGVQADQGLSKMTKSFKDAIKDQKELIKSIEGDVKRLQKAYDDATAGKSKQAAGGELRSAKRALAEEQAALLGLQNQQIAANKEESSGINMLIGGLGKWVIGLASVGTALTIAKKIIASTETTTLAFHRVVEGATSGIGYFFKAIASGDWTNFFEGMDKAIRGAQEFVDEMNRIENLKNEEKIKSSEIDIRIGELRSDTFDKDALNNETRKKALTEIIKLQKEDYDNKAKLAKEEFETNLKKAAMDSGLSEATIKNLLKEYSSLEDLIALGEKYNKLKSEFDPFQGLSDENIKIQAQIDEMGAGAVEASKYVAQIGKVTMPVRKLLSDFWAKENEATAAFNQKNRRDKMQLAAVTNEIKEEVEATKKKAIEDAKLNNQLAKQKELLNKAIEDGSEKEIKAISARIAELNKEIEARDRIAKQVTDAAEFEGFVPTQVSTGLKVPSVLPKTKKSTVQKQWDEIQKEMSSLAGGSTEWEKKMQKAIADNDKEQIKLLEKELDLRNQIVNSAADLVMQIGQQIGLSQEEMQLLGATLDAFTKVVTGDLPGAAVAMLTGIISQIPTAATKFEAQIERINGLLSEQQRLIEKSEQKGGQQQARKDELEYLKQLKEIQEKRQKELEIQVASHQTGFLGGLIGSGKNKLKELNADLKETNNLIEDANEALSEFYTDTTAASIADAIAQGFQDGKTSAADFASTFNDLMIQAINASLEEMSKRDIAAWREKFAADMASNGGLSQQEVAQLKINWDEIIKVGKAQRDAVYSIAGLNPISGATVNQGLSMGIQRNISEQTGTELAGIIRGQRDDIRAVKDYSMIGVNHLVGIEKNTYGTWQELQKYLYHLETIAKNTKQNSIGPL